MKAPLEYVEPIAKIVSQKTHGNPLFIKIFLMYATNKSLVYKNSMTNLWEWNFDNLGKLQVIDDVFEFLMNSLTELPGN